MERKKKREFKFYWEEPEKFKEPEKRFSEPFEFRFTFPRIKFTEMKRTRIWSTETDKKIIVKAELPEFKKDDINLNVTESTVEISAMKKREKIDQGEKYFRREKKAGGVRHVFTLPTTVDPEKTVAEYDNDVLTVTMPKSEKKKKRRKIEIN